MKAFLDTHIAVQLYRNQHEGLSPLARDQLERSALFLSPMAALELRFLHTIGRIRASDAEIVAWLADWRGVRVSRDDFHDVFEASRAIDWTRDPFDVLIVATAMLHAAPLVSLDATILQRYPGAIG